MLRRDDERGGAHRLLVLVLQRDLALGVGLEEGGGARMAVGGHALEDLVAVVERGGHQPGRLVGGVAEHDALVARALVLVAALVDAHRDVRGLRMQVVREAERVPVEARLLVADPLDRRADRVLDLLLDAGRPIALGVHDALAADLARDHDHVGGGQRLARDARLRVLAQEEVDDRIADLVGDLVGMAFGHGLGGEEIIAAHRFDWSLGVERGRADLEKTLYKALFICPSGKCHPRQKQRYQQHRPIAEMREQRGRQRGRHRQRHHPHRALRQRLEHAPVGIDDRRDAGGGRADDGQALLDRAKAGLGEMLRRAGVAEPRVVRGIEDEAGAVRFVDDVAREDHLVADLQPDLAEARQRQRLRAGAGEEVDVAGDEPRQADRRQQRPHRQIFAVGHEMRLVVGAEQRAARADREHPVTRENLLARRVADRRLAAAEQYVVRPQDARQLGAHRGIVLRVALDPRFGPQHEPRLGARRRPTAPARAPDASGPDRATSARPGRCRAG